MGLFGIFDVLTVARNRERMRVACLLSMIGGFLDIYTYIYRGNVFANAVTGNMVLFGFKIAEAQWAAAGKYALSILFYALGVFASEYIHYLRPAPGRIRWYQLVLALEAVCLSGAYFIPRGGWDYVVNALIAFVCALQVQTFRKVRGLPFASTMCTGNLKSGMGALFEACVGRDRLGVQKALTYYMIIGFFIFGAAMGAVLLRDFGTRVFFLAPVGLLIVLAMSLSLFQTGRLRLKFWPFGHRGTRPAARGK